MPLGHSAGDARGGDQPAPGGVRRADDGTRTRDPHLGKVMRYQLRYVRIPGAFRVTDENFSPVRVPLPNRIPPARRLILTDRPRMGEDQRVGPSARPAQRRSSWNFVV